MPTAEPDLDLIQRYARVGDPDAFAEIVRRHTSMVYYTCLRVLHDRTLAEDASQDTFFRLMRSPAKVNRSLGAWLHTTATRRCLDVLRSETARRRREREHEYARSYAHGRANPPSWSVLSPQIDEALTKIPEPTRTLLIEHFLAGKSQRQLAKETKTSTATVCRRIKAGLLELRKILGDSGFVAAAATLTALFASQASQAAPQALTAELGKMAMVSGNPAALGSSGIHFGPVSLKAAALTAAGAAVICLAIYGVAHVGNGSATVIPPAAQDQAPSTE
jgi:RNA polymerase sigma factor (sigma-70 family)